MLKELDLTILNWKSNSEDWIYTGMINNIKTGFQLEDFKVESVLYHIDKQCDSKTVMKNNSKKLFKGTFDECKEFAEQLLIDRLSQTDLSYIKPKYTPIDSKYYYNYDKEKVHLYEVRDNYGRFVEWIAPDNDMIQKY